MQITDTYEQGTLYPPYEGIFDDAGVRIAAHWRGNAVTFHIPLQILWDAYPGKDLELGDPSASSDGPHPLAGPQAGTLVWQDWVHPWAFNPWFASPPVCSDEEEAGPEPATARRTAPSPAFPAFLLVLLCAFARRKQVAPSTAP